MYRYLIVFFWPCNFHLYWVYLLAPVSSLRISTGLSTGRIMSSANSPYLPFWSLPFLLLCDSARTSCPTLSSSGRQGILDFFVILGRRCGAFQHWVCWWAAMFSPEYYLSCWGIYPLFLVFYFLYVHHVRLLNFIKCLFCVDWDDHVFLTLYCHDVNFLMLNHP